MDIPLPSWKVAGVDYAVGIPQGTVLKDPATISMAGVTVDQTNHQVLVTAANVTLDAYDFSLAGGWEVVSQAANTTISNSNFKIGANHNPLVTATTGSSNLTVLNCVLDGNNTYDTLDNDLIGAFTPGLTVKYSLLENGYAHLISAAGGQLTLEYNLLYNTGNLNAHPDWLQTQQGDANIPYTETILYNTAVQTSLASRPVASSGTQGFMLNDSGSVIANAEFASGPRKSERSKAARSGNCRACNQMLELVSRLCLLLEISSACLNAMRRAHLEEWGRLSWPFPSLPAQSAATRIPICWRLAFRKVIFCGRIIPPPTAAW